MSGIRKQLSVVVIYIPPMRSTQKECTPEITSHAPPRTRTVRVNSFSRRGIPDLDVICEVKNLAAIWTVGIRVSKANVHEPIVHYLGIKVHRELIA